MKKQTLYTTIFISLIVLSIIIVVFYTYALFETNKNVPISSDLAKWNIKVNDTMITNGNSSQNNFNIGSINWQSGGHVREGKAAPGSIGKFNIEIDPTDTQVSFVYTIKVDLSELDNDEFQISEIKETNGNEFIRTGEDTYVGIARLSDNEQGKKYNIEISLIWNNNEENNDKDTELGKKAEEDIDIPVEIDISQYIGTESFTPYEE